MTALAEAAVPRPKQARISAVIACYRDAPAVPDMYRRLTTVFEKLGVDFEIIFVNDASPDDARAVLAELAARDPHVVVINHTRNFGSQSAFTSGMRVATGDAVVLLDGDLQDPPELIGRMVAKWREGYDVVYARRSRRDTDDVQKRVTAGLFYRIHNWIADVRIPDNAGDFRLMDRRVVEAIKHLPEKTRFMKGLFAWVGFRQTGIEYRREARAAGASKWRYWKLWNFALDGLTGASTVPLRIWTYCGAALALATTTYALWLAIHTLVYGNDVPGYASLMVAVLLLGSVNILATGILGEYVGRIYTEVRNRPLYLVREMRGIETQTDGSKTWNAASIAASTGSKAGTGGSARAARS